MRYLLLAYRDEQQWDAMECSEREALPLACRESDEALASSGRLLAADVVERASPVTVRVRRGAVAVAEGAVAPAREQLSAVFIITARDLNEAIMVAAMMPQSRAGPLEVRPLLEREAP